MRQKEFSGSLATKEPVSFRMDKKVLRALRLIAIEEKISVTALVARLAKEYVDACQKKKIHNSTERL
jgi:hypothetical protein